MEYLRVSCMPMPKFFTNKLHKNSFWLVAYICKSVFTNKLQKKKDPRNKQNVKILTSHIYNQLVLDELTIRMKYLKWTVNQRFNPLYLH